MKRLTAGVLGILLLIVLTGCSWFGDEELEREWVIMVYLDGDNNLDDAAREDFHEMEYGLANAEYLDPHINEKLAVIVQYDSFCDGKQGRFMVTPASSPEYLEYPSIGLIEPIAEPDMGNAETLKEFIDFCKERYPARHYGLILWNHGGGVKSFREEPASSKAICWDDDNNEDSGDDPLYIGEIKDVLTEEQSVDFLGMDACLMGMAEVAYEFRPGTGDFGADAICFSPATEQLDGWEYDRIIRRINGSGGSDPEGDAYIDPSVLTAQQLARIAAEEYEDAFSSLSWETQTAVDLTKIDAVKQAVDAFAEKIAGKKEDIEAIRGSGSTGGLMAYFDKMDAYEWKEYAGFDLYELAQQVHDDDFLPEVKSAASSLMSAVDDAVIYSWAGGGYSSYYTTYEQGKNGLSIFFPDGDALYDETYTYWDYQYFYTSLPNPDLEAWAETWTGSLDGYGDIDFCSADGDDTVESWFEMLQSW
jgi:clostripain